MKRWLLAALAVLVASGADVSAQTAAMRETVYKALSKAETAAQEKRFDDAFKALRDVEKTRNLSNYERAQLYTALGFVHYSQDDYRQAAEAYEKVLEQQPLPPAMQTGTLYTLAQLQFQLEDYVAAATRLEEWLRAAENPGPQPYILLAQAYYQQGRLEDALAPAETAISVARAKGQDIQESWYLLQRVIYYELERFDDVARILEILVTRYPKKEYWVQLAALYGETGDEEKRLAAYALAHLQGLLTRSGEKTLYAQLLLQAEVPYRAARVIADGLADGTVEKSEENLRLLAQAWMLAHEDRKAVEALTEASGLSKDGELDARLAQAYLNLGDWDLAVQSARSALDRGVDHAEDVHISLGMALYEQKNFQDARKAFQGALQSESGRSVASKWIAYIDSEQRRLAELERSLK